MPAGPGGLLSDPGPLPSGGLPGGTLDYACGLALAGAALAGHLGSRVVEVSPLGIAVQVWLPEVMAAAYRSPDPMRPAPPAAAPGGGWYHADLGSPGARDDFSRLLAVLPPDIPAPALAAAAQEWRLPVCDYRPLRAAPPICPVSWATSPAAPTPATGGLRVCDLTNMWAGPLATWLLAALDVTASVDKVEPSFRPDGFRALVGGGIYPDGQHVQPGQDSAMWNALNRGKNRLDLDLRDPGQFSAFLAAASGSDVVISSFSPRVMHNFGLVDRLLALPRLPLLVSMPAFPPGPQRDWVAFGNGIHAVLGLGDTPGGFAAPAVSYPDPLGGLAGALAVLAGVVGRANSNPVSSVEVSLAGASQPLLSCEKGLRPAPPGVGASLLELASSAGLMETVEVAGSPLLHPASPFSW